MITALVFCFKCLYWMLIGWWLVPIKWLINRKKKKMENEILKNEYNKIKKKED